MFLSRRRLTLPRSHPRSTISAGGLNFCVRNGNRCDPSAVIAGKANYLFISASRDRNSVSCIFNQIGRSRKTSFFWGIKPHDLLVPVSSMCYHTSTPGLSTSSSSRGLQGPKPGISKLEVGFPLRCFQRLSDPDVATRLCRWRDNRNTRGPSIPVLSY